MVFVPAVGNGKLDLRPHAVGAGDQHGVPIAVQGWREQRAEPAKSGDDTLARGAVRNLANTCDKIVAAIDVDTGVPVAEEFVRRAAHLVRDGTGFIVHRGFIRRVARPFPPACRVWGRSGFGDCAVAGVPINPGLTCRRRFQ